MSEDQSVNEDNDESIIPITEWPVDQMTNYFSFDDSNLQDACKKRPINSSSEEANNTSSNFTKKVKCEVSDTSFVCRDKEPMAFTRVAKWWRKNKEQTQEKIDSENPYTKLFLASRTTKCKDFLHNERDTLFLKLGNKTNKKQANIYAALASLEDWLGEFKSAKKHITTAVALDPDNQENEWLQEKLFRQCAVLEIQREALLDLGTQALQLPQFREVLRISSKNLSLEEFRHRFVKKGEPVILTEAGQDMTDVPWDLNLVKKLAGDCQVMVKRSIPQSVEWARLEDSRTVLVSEFIEALQKQETEEYLFDWSLPLHCPEMAKQLRIPSFFAVNFLQQTSPGSLYHDSWPSLFVAPAGVKSNLHVDAFASNFWMVLFQGQKRWTFFPPEDAPYLYPLYFHSMDPVFEVDLTKPDLTKHPLFSLTHPKQCVLQPGELLFVPGGCPHFVENMTNSVAVSSNFVDQSNYTKVCKELRINGLIDPRAAELLQQLKSDKFTRYVQTEKK